MDLPLRMTGPSTIDSQQTIDYVKDVIYNFADQATSMKYLQYEFDSGGMSEPRYYTETKEFNVLFQMTRQKTTMSDGETASDLEYRFSATQNNGRIVSRKNWNSGEEVLYTYDALNRLPG